MIKSFKDRETEGIRHGRKSRRLAANIQTVVRRKMRMLNNARSIVDLRIPQANRLERLKGRRKGQHSIRINDQWLICFRWAGGEVYDVEIVDCH